MFEQELQPVRGTRDFMPSEARKRQKLFDLLKKAFERYGFLPLETPAFENWSVLSAKYAGGDEILKEAYKFQDQGGRELGLRYDLTVPLCRVVAGNPRLGKPFKRYQIASVWRDGPVSSQRLREFVQADADIIGSPSINADAECVALASDVFTELDLDYVVRVNNRQLLNDLLDYCGVPTEKQLPALLSVDKLDKIGFKGVEKELVDERELSEKSVRKLMNLFKDLRGLEDKKVFSLLKKIVPESIGLKALQSLVDGARIFGAKNVVVDVSLARGLAYYTGSVFEVLLKDSKVSASVAGGGRYDDLIASFSGSKEKTPAVGISFGVERILEALGECEAVEAMRVFVVPVAKSEDVLDYAFGVTGLLRQRGVSTDADLMQRSVSKNLEYAGKQGFSFVLILGERELKQRKVTLRNMASGKEELVSLDDVVKLVKN